MGSELQVFSNPAFGSIRTVTVDGDPWFAGKDVATALGYTNSSKAVIDHVDAEDKSTQTLPYSQNGNTVGKLTIINESGLYSLILSSKLPSAKRFKRWVTGEVLPALRKTGKYDTAQPGPQRPLTPDDYLRAASTIATCKNERLPYVLRLLERAGIDTALLPEKGAQRPQQPYRDTSTARLINRACNEYGVSMGAIGRQIGLYSTQISRIRSGSSFPSPERAALIQDAIYRLVPELNDAQ